MRRSTYWRVRGLIVACLLGATVVATSSATLPVPPAAALGVYPTGFQEDVVVSGLNTPTAIAVAPDGKMFVALKDGIIQVIDNGVLQPTPFVDLSSDVNGNYEHGLLGIAVHPQFPVQPYVYALYVHDPVGILADGWGPRVARLERIRASTANPNVADVGPGARTVLLGANGDLTTITDTVSNYGLTCWRSNAQVDDCIPQDSFRHNIGTVAFGPDGALYFGNGDGDRRPNGPQTVGNYVGSIMRIDPITGRGLADNPFYDGNLDSNRSKVWAVGFRNPFRFSLHPTTGQMIAGDVGENAWEELDNVQAGGNYGWPCYEGTGRFATFETQPVCQNLYAAGTAAPPMYQWGHTASGASVTAGGWYLGTTYPTQYRGAYFFGDYSQGWIKTMTGTPAAPVVTDFATIDVGQLVWMGFGHDSNLYWLSIYGTLYRVRYVGPNNVAPTAEMTANPVQGGAPLIVNFDGSPSFDPDGTSITYAWDFGDGGTSTVARPVYTYASAGVFTARLTVRDASGATGTTTRTITVGGPTLTITSPANGVTVPIGTTVSLTATASSVTDGNLSANIVWSGTLHHNVHTHPDLLNATGPTASIRIDDHGDDVWTEVCAAVTDSAARRTTSCVRIDPATTSATLQSIPPGATMSFEGVTGPGPLTVVSTLGSVRTVSAPASYGCAVFSAWSDGGAITHPVTVTAALQLTASYSIDPACEEGQIGEWQFEETSGLTVTDSSGSSNHGQLVGGPSRTAAGRLGQGLVLDGANDVAIVAPSQTTGSFGNQLTIAGWVNPAVSGVSGHVLSRQLGATAQDQFYLMLQSGQPRIGVNTTVGGNQFVQAGTAAVNGWTHIAGTYDGAHMRLYMNGAEVGSLAKTGPVTIDNTRPIIVGGNANGTDPNLAGELFRGVIDEVGLYTRALTPAAIAALATATPAPDSTPPSPIAGITAAVTTTTASISWAAATDNVGVTGYVVSRSGLAASVCTGLSLTCSISGLTAGTSYTVAVVAVDAAGNTSTPTSVQITTTSAPTVRPSAPTGLVVVPSATTATLTWTDTSTNEADFVIRRRVYSVATAQWGAWTTIAVVPANSTTTVDPSGIGRFQYAVGSRNTAGTSQSSTVSATVGAAVAVSGLRAVLATTGVTLTWNDTATEATYRVDRRTFNTTTGTWGAYAPTATLPADTLSYSATLVPGRFEYRIVSLNAAGSATSAAVAVTFGLPSAPTGITATVAGRTVTVGWVDTSTTEANFVIERRSLVGTTWGAFATVATIAANTTSYVETPPLGSYSYRVRAINSAGSATSAVSVRVNVR